jgi:O-antigen/teichoic acid export membrane protein
MSEIYRNILRLASGSATAQMIPLIAYPILTRIYTPEDFGTFATVVLLSSLLGIIASGSYEHAILVTKSKLEAANLVVLTLIRSTLVLLMSILVLAVTKDEIAVLLNDPGLQAGLYFVPFVAMGGIVFACHSEWLVKYKEYSLLSRNRILQGIFLISSKMLFGITSFFSQPLIFGELIGRFLTSFLSAGTILKIDYKVFRGVSLSEISNSRSRFSRFPKIMSLEQFFNIFSGSVHILFIGAAFGAKELGYVTLLFSSLYLPITVISTSIKDVFRQKANIAYRETGTCRPLYLSIFKVISLFGVFAFALGFFLAPSAFPFIFGDEWSRVGSYAQIMIPMYYFNFVSMSLGGVLIFSEKIKASLYWQILSFATSVLALYIGCYIVQDIFVSLILLAVSRAISYIAYGILSYYYSLDHSKI